MRYLAASLLVLITLAPVAKAAGSATRPARSSNPFFAMDTAFVRAGLNSQQQYALLKELGYDGISFNQQSPAQVGKTVQAAAEQGLRTFALYCSATVTPAGELTHAADLPAMMDALKGKADGVVIWLHIGGKGPAFDALTGDEPLVKTLRELSDRAAANGLRVAIYPHVGEWTARFGDAVRLAEVVKHKHFGVSFNLCHALAMGDEKNVPALLEKAAPVLFVVTINGADAGVTGADWGKLIQPLGKGTYDVGIVLRKLKEIGYTGPVGFQGFGIKDDARTLLTPTMAAWKKAR